MNLSRLTTIQCAGLLILLIGLAPFPVQAENPACGTVLSENTKLDGDLECPGRALFFNGPESKKVILDCDGFTVSTTSDRIVSANFVTGITIRNCHFETSHDDGRGLVFTGVTDSKVIDSSVTTSGDGSSAFDIRGGSKSNQFSNLTVHTSGANSNAFRIRTGSDKNTIKNNWFQADESYALNIQSASKNEFSGNTLNIKHEHIYQARFNLQNGGIAVDAAGNVFGVENNWGSSAPNGAGIGKATAYFQIDPTSGNAMSVVKLVKQNGKDIGFGFDALEILPNGRVLALRGCCANSYLFEIDPTTGAVTDLGLFLPPGAQGSLTGLDALDNDTLLATTNQGNLIEIDLVLDAMSLIGDVGTGWTGVAVHPNTGDVYTVSRRRNEITNTAHLYKVNVNDGSIVEEIGDTGRLLISGIDFAPDGTLYGSNQLEVIDIVTGVSTPVGGFGPDPLEPLSKKNQLKNTTLQNQFGSLRYPGTITLPKVEVIDISTAMVALTENELRVESAELPFLDEKAQITFENLAGNYRNLLIDPEDDGSFETCGKPCKFVSFNDGTLVFDVKGFTTYSSEEVAEPSLNLIFQTLVGGIDSLLNGPGLGNKDRKKIKSARKNAIKGSKHLKKKPDKALKRLSKSAKSLKGVDSAGELLDLAVASLQAALERMIDNAFADGADDDLIDKARTNMASAQNAIDQGKPDKAIKEFASAWKNTDKAIRVGGGSKGEFDGKGFGFGFGETPDPDVELWSFGTDDDITGPAIADDGTIYIGSEDSFLYALTPDGNQVWKFRSENHTGIETAPVIGPDGSVYFVDTQGTLHALSPDKTLQWTRETGEDQVLAIAGNGNIVTYAGVYAPDGTYLWGGLDVSCEDEPENEDCVPEGNWLFAIENPVIDSFGSGTVYSTGAALFAIDLASGQEKWSFAAAGDIRFSPAIGTDGTLYFGDSEGVLYAVDRDSNEVWSVDVIDEVSTGTPLIAADGSIYALFSEGGGDERIYAYSSSGVFEWFVRIGLGHKAPVIGADGTIYITTNTMRALTPEGDEKWSAVTFRNGRGAPAIRGDEILLAPLRSRLYALDVKTGGPSNSPWPKERQNLRNTGVALSP